MMALEKGRSRNGGVIVFCAIALLVLMSMAGLVVDGGNMFLIRQRLQAAVDAAALGAAQMLPTTVGINARAALLVNLNNPGGKDLNVITSTSFRGDSSKVEVVATVNYTPMLLAVMGLKNVAIGARAVGQRTASSGQFDPFPMGMFGENSISFTGQGNVDSYDSTLGAYGGTNVGSNATVSTDANATFSGQGFVAGAVVAPGTLSITGQGHVKSATAGGNVTMSGQGRVDGNLVTNGTLSSTGQASVGGTTTQNAGVSIPDHTLPQIDTSIVSVTNNNSQIPAALAPTGSPPSINLGGQGDVTLPPGTYYLNNVTLGGQAKIRLTGTTKLYVTGSFTMGGQTEFISASNTKFGLFYTSSTALSFSGQAGASFTAGVYAPNAAVSLTGQADFSGVFVGKSLSMAGQGEVHVDTGLRIPVDVVGGGVPRQSLSE